MLNPLKKIFVPMMHRLGRRKMLRVFDREPLIIGGCGRSGTTLLLSILSAHPSILAIPKELSVFNYWEEDEAGRLVPLRLDRLHREILRRRIPKGVHRWSEKTPRNVRHIPEINRYFDGRMKFIHIIRDGRDVTLSRHPDRKDDWWVGPDRWVEDVRAGLSHADDPNVLTIYYEKLVRDYEPTMQEVCDFIDEPFTDSLRQWHEHSTVRSSNAWHTGLRELSDRSVEKWRKLENKSRVKEFEKNREAMQLLGELGYPL